MLRVYTGVIAVKQGAGYRLGFYSSLLGFLLVSGGCSLAVRWRSR